MDTSFSYQIKRNRVFPATVLISSKRPNLIEDLVLELGSIPWKIFTDQPRNSQWNVRNYIGIKNEYLKYCPNVYPAGVDYQCILIKTEFQGPILTAIRPEVKLYDYNSKQPITDYTAVSPAAFLRHTDNWNTYTLCYGFNTKCRCFLTREDWVEDKEKKEARKQANKEAKKQAQVEAFKNPAFNLCSPMFEVIEVMKPTQLCPVKTGDMFQLVIPFVGETEVNGKTLKNGQMRGSGSTNTNWVDLYINGEYVKKVSPVEFPKVYLQNFKVRVINKD